MEDKNIFTEEQMDFITEMMNIGAGNAATALSQLLKLDVKMQTAKVHILSDRARVQDISNDLLAGVTGVKIKLVGDFQGDTYFFIADEERLSLALLAEKGITGRHAPMDAAEINEFKLSALSEIGNILTGVYMSAIYEFCKLRIYHSVPALIRDTVSSMLDRFFTTKGHDRSVIIFVENEFVFSVKNITTWFMLVAFDEDIDTLMKSIEKARFY